MQTARSVMVSAVAIMAALGFSVGAQADLCMMMQTMGGGTGCYSVTLPK
jgi:hypothetical protein